MVGAVEQHDHRRVLAALALVDRDRIGQLHAVELLPDERQDPPGEVDLEAAALDADRPPHVAVEDLEVVVVAHLEHPIADAEGPTGVGERLPAGVQPVLQQQVEAAGAHGPLVHRREDLHVVEGIEAPGRQALPDDLQQGLPDGIAALSTDTEEVPPTVLPLGAHRRRPLQDAVGIAHDARALGLAVDLLEPGHRRHARRHEVGEDLARPDRRELIGVAHEHQPTAGRQGFGERVQQGQVDHRDLVDQHRGGLLGQGSARRALEAALLRVVLQQPVQGARGLTAGLAEPLGRPTRGRRQRPGLGPQARRGDQDLDDRGLPRAWTPGDDAEIGPQRQRHGRPLLVAEQQLDPLLRGPHRLLGGQARAGPGHQGEGDLLLHPVHRAVVDRPGRGVPPSQLPSPHHGRPQGQPIEGGRDRLPGHVEQAGAGHQLTLREVGVALLGSLEQQPPHSRLGTPGVRGGDAVLQGEGVGGAEGHAADLRRHAVGVRGDDLQGLGAPGLDHPARHGRAQAVAPEHDRELPIGPVPLPVGHDLGEALHADAGDLPQALGVVLQHREGLEPEVVHHPPGQLHAQALHGPAGQVALQAPQGARVLDQPARDLELATEARVLLPGPVQDQVGAEGEVADRTDHGVAMPLGIQHLRHREAPVFRLERDVPQLAFEPLGVGAHDGDTSGRSESSLSRVTPRRASGFTMPADMISLNASSTERSTSRTSVVGITR